VIGPLLASGIPSTVTIRGKVPAVFESVKSASGGGSITTNSTLMVSEPALVLTVSVTRYVPASLKV